MSTPVTALRKALRAERSGLRQEWAAWKKADIRVLAHFDLCLAPCSAKCGICEGCCSFLYRADRASEIAARGHAVNAKLAALTPVRRTRKETR